MGEAGQKDTTYLQVTFLIIFFVFWSLHGLIFHEKKCDRCNTSVERICFVLMHSASFFIIFHIFQRK
ncbi:MAG: hypothetical protein BYD32DRAFT_412010 [Podila humilis]|nr:MAG: hypothetical protein BYD32DRAFT_412010 [Podila humilis]